MENVHKALISIITYKRPNGLKRLLQALQEQKIEPGLSTEILVIDNDCTGENPKVVAELEPKAKIKINIIQAPIKGIVSARNKAVEYFLETDFTCLVFIDDDEWPSESSWLQTLVNTQIETNADIVTSRMFVLAENSSYKWVEKVFGSNTHIRKKVSPTRRFYTNNLLIMRKVLEVIKPAFDLRFAFTGSSDLHFCIKCLNAGFTAIYTPHAPVKEFYPASRSNLRWFFLRGYRAGEGATRANLYEGKIPNAYFYCLSMFVLRLGRGFYNAVFGITTFDKALFARSLLQIGSGIGTLGGLFGISYEEYKTIHGS